MDREELISAMKIHSHRVLHLQWSLTPHATSAIDDEWLEARKISRLGILERHWTFHPIRSFSFSTQLNPR